jgi:pimeloyl-ACP methyl ester carboxylesterase
MRLLVRQKLPSDEYAPKVICPVLIIASRSDEIVSFSTSERLSKLFSSNVEFMILDNELHNYIFQGDGVFDRIRTFLLEFSVTGVREI